MTHHAAQRQDTEPWLVRCIVQGADGAEQTQVRIGYAEGKVFLARDDGKPVLWFTYGRVDELVHFLLLGANRASYHAPRQGRA
jgi:hypothetical protein